MRQRPLVALLLVLAGWVWLAAAEAQTRVELVYVREAGCPWCRLFDRQIGPVYDKTEEGRIAPLRDLDRRDPALVAYRLASPVLYSPTFVLVLDGAELGRIEGYPGEDFFWGRLGRLIERLPADLRQPSRPGG
jgi:hypothetical protein